MKRVIKWTCVIVLALLAGIFIFQITYVGDGKLDEGTYKIKDFPKFRDAYITVKDDKIQFSNIDLNSIYREHQIKTLEKAYERLKELGDTSNPKLNQNDSDFNYYMVQNAFPMDYVNLAEKTGSFTYSYACRINNSHFSLGIVYDSLHKTIKIDNDNQPLEFKK